MVQLSRVLAGSLVAMLLMATPTTGATQAAGQPLQVMTASLTQAGQDLVWRLVMRQPFLSNDLARNHRSLCLLFERTQNGTVAGQACLVGRRGRHGGFELSFMRVIAAGEGAAQVIPATVSRTSYGDLTATFLPADARLSYGLLRWQVLSTVHAPACSAPTASSLGCDVLFPSRPTLLRLHTPKLIGCSAAGPEWVSQGPRNAREIALTFDDGPWTDPPAADFVKLLDRERVPATFFEIGRQISEYDPHGTVERQMLADGDMIGNHTWSHPDMVTLSAAAQRAQLLMTAATIKKATGGFEPCLFRAPYGAVDSGLLKVARALGLATIQWDVDPRDWALPGVSAIENDVIANAHNGAIVIEHFGGGPRHQTLDALPREIAGLRARGYEFVTVTQMLGYKLIYR